MFITNTTITAATYCTRSHQHMLTKIFLQEYEYYHMEIPVLPKTSTTISLSFLTLELVHAV